MDLYSLLNFLKMFFTYIIGLKENHDDFSIEGKYKNLNILVNDLIRLEPEVSHSLDVYNPHV